ncbi:sensor histidine kinase [Murimonas intestini]|uniref:histidine kinase n=1 Tax=Murimonas intestini TaxID=1337051 RepID=A0AB73T521_9FIRM|nr:HAMP domain-containing sensor histidine kinase [Murimonas intestini]MCR1840654.1 HAMP domain-containing histidine kinase [Murimonas intestini]MCR1865293.1 HAMP domain-containing histidine kinase [Murimonas intestini]MCR1882996.1 HAMP domain-containing histidine kinase [Murimonas intestini]
MMKTLRKKFILFAMSAVTILLIVLIGAINGFSWIILDRQSDSILHTLVNADGMPLPMDFPDQWPFMPAPDMDAVKSALFFIVHTDTNGNVLDVNIDQISSVDTEQAIQYAGQITGTSGKIDGYKYEVKQLGTDRLIFFMEISAQISIFIMVLSVSSVIAVICWLVILLFVVMFSSRFVRPIIAGIEKQKQFITNAGHELKTPLAIIQSNNDASALIHGETKYSKNIRLQTQRLNVLMTNLLTLAKLDEEVKLPTETVDISELICGIFSAYEDSASEKQITLSAKIQPHILMQIHMETFMQMISILLDNAVKYTPEGGTILFSVRTEGVHIKILEENTCENPHGTDPERLFERFYRGDDARTQNSASSGYGIGLSAARAIAETFGGKLTAEYPETGKIRFTAFF